MRRYPARVMAVSQRPELRYESRLCRVMNRTVWAIRAKQPDGQWRVVNCLDKLEICYGAPCAFTNPDGDWPFPSPSGPRPDPSQGRHA